jgi:hypothetical protein
VISDQTFCIQPRSSGDWMQNDDLAFIIVYVAMLSNML